MIALDTNILIYAHRRDSPQSEAARRLIRNLAESPHPWAIPWPCIHEFLSVVTRSRYYKQPSTMTQAQKQVDAWLASPSVRTLHESARHWAILSEILAESKATGSNVHDAKIAAICLAHGVFELLTADVAFAAGDLLRTRDPFSGEVR